MVRERPSDGGDEFFVIEGFDQEGDGTHGRCSPLHAGIASTGHDDDARARRNPFEFGVHLKSGHSIHPDIENGNWNRVTLNEREKIGRLTETAHLDPFG